ncbi:hypothetical protein ACFQZ4_42475 [Catellatospora coxensis]
MATPVAHCPRQLLDGRGSAAGHIIPLPLGFPADHTLIACRAASKRRSRSSEPRS